MVSPLSKLQKENESRWDVLVDVPEWEEGRVFAWIKAVTHHGVMGSYGTKSSQYNEQVLQSIQRKKRFMFSEIGLAIDDWYGFEAGLEKLVKSNPERFILVLELLATYVRDNPDQYGNVDFDKSEIKSNLALVYLDNALSNGSKWRVVFEKNAEAGLEERAGEEITRIAQSLANKDLTDAWSYAFGTAPNAKLAIEKAQNAIEYFATKEGLTTTKSGIYGALLGDIKAHPDKYESSAVEQYAEIDNSFKPGDQKDGKLNDMMSHWVWHAMELIQKVNVIRHMHFEKEGYEIPVEAARQAVLMATIVCEFFANGYFKKGDHRPGLESEGSPVDIVNPPTNQ